MDNVTKTIDMSQEPSKYELIRVMLKNHDLNPAPAYSGFGLEVYHSDTEMMMQMVVDFNTDQIRITFPKTFCKSKVS